MNGAAFGHEPDNVGRNLQIDPAGESGHAAEFECQSPGAFPQSSPFFSPPRCRA